ncbi:MAG: hypothetical protein K0R57_5020 [Paenibacillaceae bacterium]|jgi:hypothetical protein|nr:hypothetical protein [Paenibacillaceae bacterium]
MTAGLKVMVTTGSLVALTGGWLLFQEFTTPTQPAEPVGLLFNPAAISLISFAEDNAAAALPVSRLTTLQPADARIDAPASPPEPAFTAEDQTFGSVEGVTLLDNKKSVIEKKGAPVTKRADSRILDMEIFDYGEWEIAFRDKDILYVAVEAEAQEIEIDGVRHSLNKEALNDSLGEPDFLAEDGWVYIRKQGAIKLYFDQDSGDLSSIHYFHSTGI